MKLLLLIFFLLLSFHAGAEDNGLPFESDLTRVSLPKVGIGHRLELVYSLKIPETQKLNHGAPSNVTIFEKPKGEKVWTAVKELSLNNRTWENSKMQLKEPVELKAEDSAIAVHSTVYHCGKKDTRVPCFIQGFQGFIERSKKVKSNLVRFNVVGKVN